MTIIAFVPALVAAVAVLVYFASSNAKVQEVARLAFFAGFLVFMFAVSRTIFRL